MLSKYVPAYLDNNGESICVLHMENCFKFTGIKVCKSQFFTGCYINILNFLAARYLRFSKNCLLAFSFLKVFQFFPPFLKNIYIFFIICNVLVSCIVTNCKTPMFNVFTFQKYSCKTMIIFSLFIQK